MKMNLHTFRVTIAFGFGLLALTEASMCPIEPQENSGCDVYVATSTPSTACYIHFIKMPHFSVRKNNLSTKVLFDIREMNPKKKIENDQTDITEIIGGTWTRIEPINNEWKEPNAFAIGNTIINVPERFARFKTYIWILGSVTFTNDSQCFSESLTTTTTQSTGSSHITTTQSTGSSHITTTQSTGSSHTQRPFQSASNSSLGRKRRRNFRAKSRRPHQRRCRVVDMQGIPHIENGNANEGHTSHGKEHAGGQAVVSGRRTRKVSSKVSAQDIENVLYGYIAVRNLHDMP